MYSRTPTGKTEGKQLEKRSTIWERKGREEKEKKKCGQAFSTVDNGRLATVPKRKKQPFRFCTADNEKSTVGQETMFDPEYCSKYCLRIIVSNVRLENGRTREERRGTLLFLALTGGPLPENFKAGGSRGNTRRDITTTRGKIIGGGGGKEAA